jgi:hypothetical protein
MKTILVWIIIIFGFTSILHAKESYNCVYEAWNLENGKPKTHTPNLKKAGTLSIDDKIVGDGSGKTQGLFLKGEGFVAHAMALRLPDAKNGSWEDLQLEIYKDEKEIYPRSLSHNDLNAKKVMVSLLTKEKSLTLNCNKN